METLRHCLPPSVRGTLDELPESLDETYERVLKEIKKPNRKHARRLLQCLVAAIRPLRVSELTEVLAVDFDDDGIPKLNPDWRWEDQDQALLASCSSLITIVEPNDGNESRVVESDESWTDTDESWTKSDESRIVQFSHFSVKEFLTSDRLANSTGDISRYHIVLEPAHAILAQACMSVLLRSDDRVEESSVSNNSPLARYAAEHWVTHVQNGEVSSCLRMAMEHLFDVDKPNFAAWLQLHDIDSPTQPGSVFNVFKPHWKSDATPLYYAALCGFQDLVEHLIVDDPTQVNATGGYYVAPLVAALAGGHFQTANLLGDNGANSDVRGYNDMTPLQSAAFYGEFEMVQVLLKYKADVNARNVNGKTALHLASEGDYHGRANFALSLSTVARLLLERGADVNARSIFHNIPLHFAAKYGRVEVVRVLLEHVANLAAEDDSRKTAIQAVSDYVNSRNSDGQTPLHFASQGTFTKGPNIALWPDVARLLLEHGADVNAQGDYHLIPLHVAAQHGRVKVVRVLLEYGADVGAENDHGYTALQMARDDETKKLLSEPGALPVQENVVTSHLELF